MRKHLIHWLFAMMALAPLGFAGCESEADGGPANGDWECDENHDDWQRCTDGVVQWCHVLEGMAPHFHNGANCAALGFDCVEPAAGEALCIDPASSCGDGEFRCGEEGTAEANTAFNCVAGNWAVEPCGTARHCHEEDGAALCEIEGEECGGYGHLHDGACHCDEGYVVDPDDATNCIADGGPTFPELACTEFQDDDHLETKAVTTTFGDVFAPEHHADLDHPVEVTLPDNEVSYIHFPCFGDGEYVVFLSVAGVLDGIQDRQEAEMVLGGGVPNGMCAEIIADHHHADLVYDGDGENPVPYVLRFAAVPSQTVRFLIKAKDGGEDEHDHDHEHEE